MYIEFFRNSVSKTKDRLIEITSDGQIDDTDIKDFTEMQKKLDELSQTVDSLHLWVNEMISSEKIDKEKLDEKANS